MRAGTACRTNGGKQHKTLARSGRQGVSERKVANGCFDTVRKSGKWGSVQRAEFSSAAWVTALPNAAAEGLKPLKGAETRHIIVSNRYRNSEGLVRAASCGLGCSLAALATVPAAALYRNSEGLVWAAFSGLGCSRSLGNGF